MKSNWKSLPAPPPFPPRRLPPLPPHPLPLLPLRCDHLRLRISGSGDVRLHALHRYLETGSEL